MSTQIHKSRAAYFFTFITGISLAMALTLVGCGGGGGGGGGGGTTNVNVPLTIQGAVYDSEVGGATVELIVGDTVIGTATSDGQGRYTISVTTTTAQRAQRAVIRARRGSVVLQSLLGVLQTAVDARDTTSNAIGADNFPGSVVSHATTALAAVIQQQNGGTLPTSQTDIDNLINTITTTPALQTLVTQIAAGIKAVVDYGAVPTSVSGGATDTQALANYFANNAGNIAIDLATLVGSTTGVTVDELTNAVESDPITAVQLPSTVDNTDIIGNSYIIGDDTLLHFQDASTLHIYDYDSVTGGGVTNASWSYSSGVMTINFTDTEGAHVVTATILGGTMNAVAVNIVFDGTNEGDLVMRRMIPMVTTIPESEIVDKLFVDVAGQGAAKFPSACNGVASGWISTPDGTIPMTCSIDIGMVIIDPDWTTAQLPEGGFIVLGFLSDAWNGSSLSLASNFVSWELDEFGDPDSSLGRVYLARDASANPCFTCPGGTESHPISFRITTDGVVSLRLLSYDYTDVGNPGGQVIYTDGNAALTEKLIWPAQSLANWPNLVSTSANNVAGTAGARLVANLGTHAGTQLRAVFVVDNITNGNPVSMTTRSQYNMQEIVDGDVSGKTFNFTDILGDGSGTVTFNANGTGSVAESSGTQSFMWSIGADALTDFAYSAAGHQYFTLLLDWDDGSQNIIYRSADLGDGSFIVGMYEIDNANSVTSVSGAVLTPQ